MLRILQERMISVLAEQNVPHRVIKPTETLIDFFEVELPDERKQLDVLHQHQQTVSQLWSLITNPLI